MKRGREQEELVSDSYVYMGIIIAVKSMLQDEQNLAREGLISDTPYFPNDPWLSAMDVNAYVRTMLCFWHEGGVKLRVDNDGKRHFVDDLWTERWFDWEQAQIDVHWKMAHHKPYPKPGAYNIDHLMPRGK